MGQRVRAEQRDRHRVTEVPRVDEHHGNDQSAEPRSIETQPAAEPPHPGAGEGKADVCERQSDAGTERESQVREAHIGDERHQHVEHERERTLRRPPRPIGALLAGDANGGREDDPERNQQHAALRQLL